jgi:hypothetical protein
MDTKLGSRLKVPFGLTRRPYGIWTGAPDRPEASHGMIQEQILQFAHRELA